MTDFLYKALQFIVFVHKDAYFFQDFLLYGNSTGSPHLSTKPPSSANEAAFICQRSRFHLPTKPLSSANEAAFICQRSLLRFSTLYTLLLKFRMYGSYRS
nr:hypothetical protein [Prevotella sp.]